MGVFKLYSLGPFFFLVLALDVQKELPVFLDFHQKIFGARFFFGVAWLGNVADFEINELARPDVLAGKVPG